MLGFAAVGWLILSSCGDSTGPSTNANAPCTITITGATGIAGAYTCSQTPVTIRLPSTNVGATSVNISGSTSLTGLFVFSRVPTAGTTYSSANSAGLQSYGIIVTLARVRDWYAAHGMF